MRSAACCRSIPPSSLAGLEMAVRTRTSNSATAGPLAVCRIVESDPFRHSFGSNHLVQHDDPGKTQLQMGQQTPSVLFKHYRQVVTRKQAAAYWSLVPEPSVPSQGGENKMIKGN